MRKVVFLCLIFFIFFNILLFNARSESIFDMGRDIFLKKGACATCHILADAGSEGQIGPDLNIIKPDITRVIFTVTNGIGVMPAYEGQLTKEEIDAVAHYVSISASK